MTDILLFTTSLDRIEKELREHYPTLRPIAWHPEGYLSCNQQKIEAEAIAPVAGWISTDVIGQGVIQKYCDLLLQLPSMRWVQSLHAGLDHPVYPCLATQGIRVSKSSAQSLPIAEYVLAYTLYHFQSIEHRALQQREKSWKVNRFPEIAGTTWLIIGFGHIGRDIAKRARAFDAEIIALRQTKVADPLADMTIGLADLKTHLPRADVVVLACPHNQQTDKLADAAFFAATAPGTLFINVARGGLVVEEELLKGLEQHRPTRAILDVFINEPLPKNSPLWDHPQIVITAHTSNAGTGTQKRGDVQFLENLGRFLRDEKLLDEVPLEELK